MARQSARSCVAEGQQALPTRSTTHSPAADHGKRCAACRARTGGCCRPPSSLLVDLVPNVADCSDDVDARVHLQRARSIAYANTSRARCRRPRVEKDERQVVCFHNACCAAGVAAVWRQATGIACACRKTERTANSTPDRSTGELILSGCTLHRRNTSTGLHLHMPHARPASIYCFTRASLVRARRCAACKWCPTRIRAHATTCSTSA